jgi:MSHA biogenesis protein MshN
MSLINQMLQDLEKRGEDPDSSLNHTKQYVQYGSTIRRSLSIRLTLVLVGLLVLVSVLSYGFFFRNKDASTNHPMNKDEEGDLIHAQANNNSRSPDFLFKLSKQINVVTGAERVQETRPAAIKSTETVSSSSARDGISDSKTAEKKSLTNLLEMPPSAEAAGGMGKSINSVASVKSSTESIMSSDNQSLTKTEQKAKENTSSKPPATPLVIKEVSPMQRAEGEYKQATIYQQQGRVNEAILSLEQALKLDQTHAPARQLMISLLLESKRQDEAIRELRAGLAVDSHQLNFAMMLARLLVERAKLQEATDVLQKSLAYAQDRPDYIAFLAALLQKLGRHKEAVQSYRSALSKHTQNGVWWMGLGISLQADGATNEALEAFRQAKVQPGLGADLLAFVDQKIAQLQ